MAMDIFEKFWRCLLLFPLWCHNTACIFLLEEKPYIQLGHSFTKTDLAIISKEIWKAEQRHSLELVPLRCCFRQFNSWGAGQDPERWVTCQEVRQEAITGLPSWFRVPCSLGYSSSWATALVEQKSTMCQFISVLCVCSQDSSKAQSTEEHRALPVYGREKRRYLGWEKRCLSGEANREAGKFPGGSSRLANIFFRVPNSSAEVYGCSRSC